MPTITAAKVTTFGTSNNRLEFEIEAVIDGNDAAPVVYGFNVSDNKHCVASYKTGGSTPTAAPPGTPNTLVAMSASDFSVAFREYGRLIAAKMVGEDPATFDPSDDENRIQTKSIAFVSDRDSLSNNVHCYPVWISDALTPKCVELDFTQFNHFKAVTKYLFRHAGGSLTNQVSTARTSWTAIKAYVTARAGQDNQLLSELEVSMLNTRLKPAASTAMPGIVRDEDRDIKSTVGKARGLAATPGGYRSTG